MGGGRTSVLWFRRDLRLADHPALLAAADEGRDGVLPLFVVDPALWDPAGPARRSYLLRSLAALDASLGGRLHVRTGDPVRVLPAVAAQAGAAAVHVSADFGPYGATRDRAVEAALAVGGRALVRTGSPYAVSPGRLLTGQGTPFRVWTPFHHAWLEHGWRAPAGAPPDGVRWLPLDGSSPLPPAPTARELGDLRLPEAGEQAALARWSGFVRSGALAAYGARRDRADLAGTSALSAALRWGEVHPRTLLAGVADGPGRTEAGAAAGPPDRGGAAAFRRELCWREFYADVLHHRPGSARAGLRADLAALPTDTGPEADRAFDAWARGCTGYPFVDAGMRQLRTEGWMHNRVRMVTASFLVKDLHLDWTRGAREFMRRLRDGDLASNQHGWQWVAGVGTDAAPYFRVFNPVLQGLRHDPDGDYVRRYVPELASLPGASVHEPWKAPGGVPSGYPERIVDHAAERVVALQRYADVAAAGRS